MLRQESERRAERMKNRMRNKIAMRATLFFVLLFFCFLPGIRANAAEQENGSTAKLLQESDIVVDYSNEIIVVKANSNTELYYGIGTGGKQPKTYQRIGTSLIAEYGSDEETYDAFYIDLSSQSFKSGTAFYAKYAENDTVVTVKLGTREKLKAVYRGVFAEDETGKAYAAAYAEKNDDVSVYPHFDGDTGYLTFLYADKDYTELADVEWRAGTATNYKELSELNLKIYQPNGSSLYFRVNNGEEPISKEAKLKISKPAKAPTVKIDGSKLTIAIKDTQEYRVEYADGSMTEWTPVEAGTKVIPLGQLEGIIGDGISQAFAEVKIQVRNAASEKKAPSLAAEIYLEKTAQPQDGESGIRVSPVDPADLSKGLNVKNASEDAYMVAIADTKAWDCGGSITELIKKIDYSAKKGAVGYLTWKTVKAGATVKLSYSSFKDFEDSYVVLFRIAPVKEDKKTAAREFRIASVVKPVGGILPVADLKSQSFLITGDGAVSKTVKFNKVDGYTLYTSVDGAEFTENTGWSLSISGEVGKTIEVKAYLVADDTEEKGDTVVYRYSFVADGELPAYANDWGYIQCKKNGWAIAYQRAYLAAVTYAESFSVEGLNMEMKEIMQVIKMMRLDNPEIIQLGNSYTLRGNDMILPLGNQDDMDKLLTECQETAKAALQKIEAKYGGNPTQIEYVKEIHDFIVLEKQYRSSAMDQTMAGILSDAYTPVCASYALSFHYMCELAGIQTVIVHGEAKNSSGKTESHVWNMVNLGETVDYSTMKTKSGQEISSADWYEIDVTWGDPVGAPEDYVEYKYFNLTTDEMTSHASGTKHVRSTGESYDSYPVEKCTGTTYNYNYLVENNYLTAQ